MVVLKSWYKSSSLFVEDVVFVIVAFVGPKKQATMLMIKIEWTTNVGLDRRKYCLGSEPLTIDEGGVLELISFGCFDLCQKEKRLKGPDGEG